MQTLSINIITFQIRNFGEFLFEEESIPLHLHKDIGLILLMVAISEYKLYPPVFGNEKNKTMTLKE